MICRRPCERSGIFCSVVLCVCRINLWIRVCHVSGRIIKSHTVAVADGNRITGFHQQFPPFLEKEYGCVVVVVVAK